MKAFQRATAVAGAGAVLCASLGASIAQRTSPTSNFISELGVPGGRLARTFRAGEAAAALACLHLGLSSIRSAKQALQTKPLPDPPRPDANHSPFQTKRALARSAAASTAHLAHGELRGLALTAAGGCLLISAALPSSPGCPVPLLDTQVPRRDWIHVPTATAAFYLWPMAATGRLRTLLLINLLLLIPPTQLDPHGRITALLQRTMTALAAAALSIWTPTSDRTRARNLAGGKGSRDPRSRS